jgi:protein-disulfide isomerase
MSHRKEQKEAARAQRLEAERSEAAKAARAARVKRLAIALGALAVAAVVLILVLGGDSDDGGGGGGDGAVAGVTESREMLEGVPQSGSTLGDPDAPVTLTEFADLQCPFCRDYALQVLPQVIQEHVRTGDLKLELQLLRFIGPDSDRGARAAVAAGEQDKMWDFVDLWYRNQGTENTSYAKDDFIRDIAAGAGLPAQEILDGIQSAENEGPITEAETAASEERINSTPSFVVTDADGEEHRLEVTELSYEAFRTALEPHLK